MYMVCASYLTYLTTLSDDHLPDPGLPTLRLVRTPTSVDAGAPIA